MLFLLVGCAADPVGFDVLLFSVDGTPHLLLEEEWDSLSVIPSVGGAYVPMEVLGTTDTKASHARMLTGFPPEVTGVVSAGEFQVVPAGLSVPEGLRERYGNAIALTYVANKPEMLGFEDGQAFQNVAGACDVTWDHDRPTDEVAAEMIDALDTRKPRFAFLHFGAVDKAGHEYGERSEEQREALHAVDAAIGEVLASVGEERPVWVYVTTDHGFTPGGNTHFTESHKTWLVTNDPNVGATGGLVDQVAGTIREKYGLEQPEGAEAALPGE